MLRYEAALLASAGHEVHVHTVSNDNITGVMQKIRTAIDVTYSSSSFQEVSQIIDSFRPTVMHVHNFFPLLTPSIHSAARRHKIPVVQTLHNYRLICAAATFSRNGNICELCLRGSKFNAVKFGCYRGSSLGSLPLVMLQESIHGAGSLIDCTDRFIALTEFGKSKFVEGGLPGKKIVVKPNFVEDRFKASPHSTISDGNSEPYYLFVGRISAEKGIVALIEAWRNIRNIKLKVAGDGPMMDYIRSSACDNIEVLGKLSTDEIVEQMRGAAALIFPSTWYEGMPMTVIEALSLGLPIIASNIGSLSEIVINNYNGLHFEAGNPHELENAVVRMTENPELRRRLSSSARQDYLSKYTPEKNLSQLMHIYEDIV